MIPATIAHSPRKLWRNPMPAPRKNREVTATSHTMSYLCPQGLALPLTRANSPSARSRKAEISHNQPPQISNERSPTAKHAHAAMPVINRTVVRWLGVMGVLTIGRMHTRAILWVQESPTMSWTFG